MKVRIIANPIAGGGRGKTNAEALHMALKDRGADVEVIMTSKAGDGRAAASDQGADCVAVVGGDGSLNEVINGLTNLDALVAVFPTGTANVVARELKIPLEAGALASLIVERRARIMDMGLHEGRRFLLGAGAGLDAAVAEKVSARRGKRSGLSQWVGPAIQTALSYAYPKIRVSADGETLCDDGEYAIVGNCRYSAAIFPATPRAKIDDGLLDVCVLRNLTVLRLLYLVGTVWRPSFIEHKDVIYRQAKDIEFHPVSEGRVPLQVDGDSAGAIPARFEISPTPIHMVTPTAPS